MLVCETVLCSLHSFPKVAAHCIDEDVRIWGTEDFWYNSVGWCVQGKLDNLKKELEQGKELNEDQKVSALVKFLLLAYLQTTVDH